MDRLKVENFLGLYTNVDEAKLNPEYQSEAVNVRFKAGYIESEGYNNLVVENVLDVIYEAPVTLDDDRLSNKIDESGELVNDYKQNLQEYLMIVQAIDGGSRITFEPLDSIISNNAPSSSPLLGETILLHTPKDDFRVSLPIYFSWSMVIGKNENPPSRWGLEIKTSKIKDVIYRNDNIPVVSYLPENPSGSIVLSGPLEIGVQYYWKVWAIAEDGVDGASSPVWNFITIENTTIDSPSLVSPTDGTIITEFPIELKWNPIVENINYFVQVATDKDFNTIVLEGYVYTNTITLTNIFSFASETKHFWRVMVFQDNGNSGWSEVWSFTTPAIPPPEPITCDFTKVYKHYNVKGVVLLLTDTGTYWVGKINRLLAYPSTKASGYYIYKLVDLSYKPTISIIETGVFEGSTLAVTLQLTETEDFHLPGTEEGYTYRAYKIEAKYSDGRIKKEYLLFAWEANGEWKIIKVNIMIPLIGPGEIPLPSGDLWNTFKTEIISPVSWLPNEDYETIEQILTATELEATVVFADENLFIKQKNEFIITYIFDNRDEYVMNYFTHEHSTGTKYAIKLQNLTVPGVTTLDKNYRITGVALYMRQDDKDDFQQVMVWNTNIGKRDQSIFDVLYIDGLSPNGIFASQTIGAVYKPKEYNPIDEFADYIEIDGVAYAIHNQRVYFPAIGSGTIMNGVFLDYIPEVEGDLLSDINGNLGVFGTQLKLVVAQDSREGYLLFSIKDKMNFRIRDQYDLATSPEGIIIHTKRGIYVTNGYERKLISEEINNLVETNFDTGNIFYSATDDMLFYSYISEGVYYTFRFDFVYGNWSEVRPGIAGRLTFSENGIIHYLNEDDGKIYKLEKTNNVYSIIRTPNVDLDYPFLGKNLIYIDTDFEGILNYEDYNIIHTKRMTARLGIPVSKRIPNALIGARFIFKGKIYTIDIYYDAIGEFRHENHIPLPEAIPEGVQRYPEYLKSLTE